ncbi:MAG: Putative membrane protein, clustering with ActP [uncultured Caballeronia sp.]|nr:MAG: Putative membrane protein, clustering with ActP [uncultured Caballeronia sp.]
MEHAVPAYPAATQHGAADRPVSNNPLLDDPRFRALVRSRRAFSWTLTVIMLAVYFAFVLTLAFKLALLGHPVTEGYPTTWGIPIGFGMFVFTFVLVAVYVVCANATYDHAVSQIRNGNPQ